MEIEKRYKLIGKIPMEEVISKKYIEQVYSVIGNDKGIPDVRIRKMIENDDIQYYHTTKYKTNDKNIRIEIEPNISQEDYLRIFDLISKKPVRKNRYLVKISDKLIAEIDEFLDMEETLVEIEFPDKESMDNFENEIKPKWLGEEIKEKQSFNLKVFSKINDLVKVKFY